MEPKDEGFVLVLLSAGLDLLDEELSLIQGKMVLCRKLFIHKLLDLVVRTGWIFLKLRQLFKKIQPKSSGRGS